MLEKRLLEKVKEIIKENPRAKSILNATLALVALGGILTLGALAPSALSQLNRFLYQKKKDKYERYLKIWRSFRSLREKRHLEFVREENGYLVYRLNESGKEKIRKFIFNELRIKTPKEWDKKWRLVIFDIPETKRKTRMALIRKLKELGFYQCQKSVWLYPFLCEEEMEFLKDFFGIKSFVKIFLIEEMTDGRALYHFREQLKSAS